ncbi:hypothetical protein DUI87_00731 [Hirundo rustica rustica]|uniref:Uncharacterized protein n=1 Tax=Hirundo rustica rustica TaxID=333673 RepID=A0A3M0LTT5_HIRRU|nr:hypothetical protein DUI87_00731 [Hirundo rustica rustica]
MESGQASGQLPPKKGEQQAQLDVTCLSLAKGKRKRTHLQEIKGFYMIKHLGSDEKNFEEVLALSIIAPCRSFVVNMKSMGQLHLIRLVGLANCEKRNFCYPSTPTHFLISTELDNTICKRPLFSLPLADNSMFSTPGTEICKPYEDVLCSRNCLTIPALPHYSLAMIVFAVES